MWRLTRNSKQNLREYIVPFVSLPVTDTAQLVDLQLHGGRCHKAMKISSNSSTITTPCSRWNIFPTTIFPTLTKDGKTRNMQLSKNTGETVSFVIQCYLIDDTACIYGPLKHSFFFFSQWRIRACQKPYRTSISRNLLVIRNKQKCVRYQKYKLLAVYGGKKKLNNTF